MTSGPGPLHTFCERRKCEFFQSRLKKTDALLFLEYAALLLAPVSISFRNSLAISSIIGTKLAGETLPELESRPPGIDDP
jgi:hypothetical protein